VDYDEGLNNPRKVIAVKAIIMLCPSIAAQLAGG
jgi:hypothetical protein